jgi:hypothetical protein
MEKLKTHRKALFLLLIAATSLTCHAQSNCFTYDFEDANVITGLTDDGEDVKELIIPSNVTKVKSGAFEEAAKLETLTIDNANPVFEGSLFGENTCKLSLIDMGNSMSVNNMYALLTSLGSTNTLSKVVIDSYSGEQISWTDNTINNVLHEDVAVVLPAAQVANQVFGNASVWGRFTIDKELISFCGNATFQDLDQGSNMLFYVANSYENSRYVHLQRVYHVVAGQGVLIHKTGNTSGYAELPRIDSFDDLNIPSANTDRSYYAQNMLKGVTEATQIGATDGNKTNLILKNAAFHPTSGGLIPANRAYLQVPTAMAKEGASFELVFSDNTTTGIGNFEYQITDYKDADSTYYNLNGQRISKPGKGIYIVNGRKYIKN